MTGKLWCIACLAVFILVANLPGFSQGDGAELFPRKTSPGSAAESVNAPRLPWTASAASSLEGFDALSPFSMGMIILSILIGGLVLLFIEVALIPGFGLPGITGILLLLSGLALAFWKLSLQLALAYSVGAFAGLVGLVLWTIYVFPHTSLGKKFVLQAQVVPEGGYSALRDLSAFVGQEGITVSDLRPSGIARIGDERVDVLSDGEFVPRNTPIRVAREKNGNLIVVPIQSGPPTDS